MSALTKVSLFSCNFTPSIFKTSVCLGCKLKTIIRIKGNNKITVDVCYIDETWQQQVGRQVLSCTEANPYFSILFCFCFFFQTTFLHDKPPHHCDHKGSINIRKSMFK